MKKLVKLLAAAGLAAGAALLLSSCGRLSSVRALKAKAEKEHGKCTEISSSESDEKNEVLLRDELQGFEYTCRSYMADFGMDGQHFFYHPQTSDNFEQKLAEYCTGAVWDRASGLCGELGVECERLLEYDLGVYISLTGTDEENLKTAAIGCAELLQEYNAAGRLDKVTVPCRLKNGEHIGQAALPGCGWMTPADENASYFTDFARQKIDGSAKFISAEENTFSHTGLSIDDISNVLDINQPKSPDDKVMFYHFEDSRSRRFYVCDFLYYDKEKNTCENYYAYE